MNAVIMSFDPNEKQSVNLREKAMKSTRKAKDKLYKACERASEIRERTLHNPGRQEQNNAHGKHERVTRQ